MELIETFWEKHFACLLIIFYSLLAPSYTVWVSDWKKKVSLKTLTYFAWFVCAMKVAMIAYHIYILFCKMTVFFTPNTYHYSFLILEADFSKSRSFITNTNTNTSIWPWNRFWIVMFLTCWDLELFIFYKNATVMPTDFRDNFYVLSARNGENKFDIDFNIIGEIKIEYELVF